LGSVASVPNLGPVGFARNNKNKQRTPPPAYPTLSMSPEGLLGFFFGLTPNSLHLPILSLIQIELIWPAKILTREL